MKRALSLVAFCLLASPLTFLTAHPGGAIIPAEPSWSAQEGVPAAGTSWRSTTSDSLRFLYFQHGYRIAFQQKTRAYLGGNFFKDYGASLKGLGGWRDGDSWGTNYVLHPMQGAASGFIFLQNSPEAEEVEFGGRRYWKSRLKAFAFAAAYGAQFELGPLSEASIGNVGKHSKTMGFVDLVVTPVAGLGWVIAEDLLDHFVIRRVEKRSDRKGLIRFLRVALNPTRSFANLMRFRLPWYRRGRELNKPFGVDPAFESGPGGLEGLPKLELEADMFGGPKEPLEFYDVLIPDGGELFTVLPVKGAHTWEVSFYFPAAALPAEFCETVERVEDAGSLN